MHTRLPATQTAEDEEVLAEELRNATFWPGQQSSAGLEEVTHRCGHGQEGNTLQAQFSP